MGPLFICSVIALAITIERFLFWRQIANRQAIEEIIRLVEHKESAKASELAGCLALPIARVMAAALAQPNSYASKAMEVAAQGEMATLKKRLATLDTIITLAPLLGLLGTVTGLIGSFDIMSSSGLGQPHAVTGGVAEALIATATGLLIAILTLVPHNYFSRRAERELEDMEYYASRLELLLDLQKEAKA